MIQIISLGYRKSFWEDDVKEDFITFVLEGGDVELIAHIDDLLDAKLPHFSPEFF